MRTCHAYHLLLLLFVMLCHSATAQPNRFWSGFDAAQSPAIGLMKQGLAAASDKDLRLADSLAMACTLAASDANSATDKVGALLLRAQIAEQRGDMETAFALFYEALELDPQLELNSRMREYLHREVGIGYGKVGTPVLGIPHVRTVLNISKRLNRPNGVYEYIFTGRLGSYFLAAGQYDSACYIFNEARQIAESLADPRWHAGAHNNLGMCEFRQGRLGAAMTFFEQALELLVVDQGVDSTLQASIQDNIATILVQQGRIEDALALYRSNYEIYRELGATNPAASAATRAARLHIQLNDLVPARKLLESSQFDAAATAGSPDAGRLEQLQVWSDYWKASGDPGKALEYNEKALVLSANMLQETNALKVDILQDLNDIKASRYSEDLIVERMKAEHKESQLQQARSDAEYKRLLYLSLLGGFALVLISVLILYRRRAADHRKQAELEAVKRQLTESELHNRQLREEELQRTLDSKKKDLTDFAIDLSQKRQFAQGLVDRLDAIRRSDRDSDMELRMLIMELKGQRQMEEKSKVLQDNVETVGREFFDNLNEAYPNLTKTERELCSLIRLGRTNKEIARIRNITPNAVKVGRYRLRKKLGLGPDDDIARFLTKY